MFVLDRSKYETMASRANWIEAPNAGGAGLDEVFRVLRRRGFVLAGALVLLSGLTTAFALTKEPSYTANAIVMVEPKVDEDEITAVTDRLSAVEEIKISTVVEVMKSRKMAEQVALAMADDIDLGQVAETDASREFSWGAARDLYVSIFGDDVKDGASEASFAVGDEAVGEADDRKFKAATDRILDDISVRRLSNSRMIEIAAKAPTPGGAARKANAHVEIYIDSRRRERHKARVKRVESLEARVEEARRELLNADLEVAKYMRENNLISARQDAAVLNRIARLESALTEAQTESMSRTLNQLFAEEAEIKDRLAKLSVVYGPGYPEIVDLREQLFAIELQISSERQRLQTRARNARAELDESAAGLQRELRSVRRQHFEALEANAGLKELEREADAKLGLFNSLSERLQRARSSLHQDRDDIKMMAEAIVPLTPSNTGRVGMIAVGGIGSLMLAALMAFAAEALDDRVRSSDHVRSYFRAPTLSMIPKSSMRRLQAESIGAYLRENAGADFTEAIRNLYLEVVSDGPVKGGRIVVVTSVLPDEGKTLVASGVHAMAKQFEHRAAIVTIDDLADDAGGAGGSSAEALDMTLQALSAQIDEMRDRFDMIIVDAPAILKSRDAKVLANLADDMLVVVEWGKTPAGALKAAREVLGPIDVGVVLNRVNMKAHANFAYGDMAQYAHKMRSRRGASA